MSTKPDKSVPDFVGMKISVNRNLSPLRTLIEMNSLIILGVYTTGARAIISQSIFLAEHFEIVKWLVWSTLVAVEDL